MDDMNEIERRTMVQDPRNENSIVRIQGQRKNTLYYKCSTINLTRKTREKIEILGAVKFPVPKLVNTFPLHWYRKIVFLDFMGQFRVLKVIAHLKIYLKSFNLTNLQSYKVHNHHAFAVHTFLTEKSARL